MHHTRTEREQHLQQQRESGLTTTDYCRQQGINRWTFLKWHQNRVRIDSRPQFIKVDLPTTPSVLEIVIPARATIRIPADIPPPTLLTLLSAVKRSRIL
jgi:hypothetical protein